MASSDASDDYEWQPPTEAEMKILQARRERSDKISKLMGEYLLKGFKMLGICCSECGTILLQNKEKHNYCVACNELDCDTGKDDPVLSQEAARRQVAEDQQRQLLQQSTDDSSTSSLERHPLNVVPNGVSNTEPNNTAGLQRPGNPVPMVLESSLVVTERVRAIESSLQQSSTASSEPYSGTIPSQTSASPLFKQTTQTTKFDVSESISVVNNKLQWATRELQSSCSIEGSIHLCQLIKACAETLATLYTVHDKNNNGAMPKN